MPQLRRQKIRIQLTTLLLQHPRDHLNTSLTHTPDTLTIHPRIRIRHTHHHTPQSRSDNQVTTRRSLTPMRTRLKRHIQRTPRQQVPIPHSINCIHLSMRSTTPTVKPLTHDTPITHHHSPHHRIRSRPSLTTTSQTQRTPHKRHVHLPHTIFKQIIHIHTHNSN